MENLGIVVLIVVVLMVSVVVVSKLTPISTEEPSISCTEIARDLTPLVNHPFVKYRCGF